MGKAPCCDKSKVKRGPWSLEEDAQLKAYIEMHGTGGNWIALPQKIGLMRCGKSCRLRWLNYLRPNLRHGGFSEEEDQTICNLYISIGSRWSIIGAQLPGRTDNDIKNYWNTKLKKKLLGPRRGPSQYPARRLKGQEVVDVMNQEMSTTQQLISGSALERMQLYIQAIQLQQQHNPYYYYYNNPLLWPRLHPLGGMIHQAQHSNPMGCADASIQEPIGNPVIDPFHEAMYSVKSNPVDANMIREDQLDGSVPIYFSSPSTSAAISSDSSNLSPLAAEMKSKQQDLLYCTENRYFKGQECKHDVTDMDYFMGMNGIEESFRYWWPSRNGFGDKSPSDSWISASAASLLQPDSTFQECGHGYNHL